MTTRRRCTTVWMRIILAFVFLLCFSSNIDGFSPVSISSRVYQRKSNANGDALAQQKVFSPRKVRDVSLQRSLTSLRGGFMLQGNPILQSIGIYAIADFAVGFIVSVVTGSHLHLDLVGSGAFAAAAVPYLLSNVAHIRWSSTAIFLWGTKLALFLLYRATKVNHDKRLTDVLSSPQGAFNFWFVTFIWNVVTSLPFLIGLQSDRDNSNTLVVGGVLYLAGLIIETLADIQKYLFKQQQSSASQFCNIGLWKYSQHPNYFGNLLLWIGILVMNLPALIEPLPAGSGSENGVIVNLAMRLWSIRKLILSCLGPGFLWLLFNGQASGSFMNTVELANSKYGGNPDYTKYVKEVPLIIPRLF